MRRRRRRKRDIEKLDNLSPQRLRALAVAIADGRVIGTWMDRFQRDPGLAMLVFLPLALMEHDALMRYRARGAHHIYAILGEDETFARGINGMPMFASCRFLTKPDGDALQPLVDQLIEQRAAFMNPPTQKEGL